MNHWVPSLQLIQVSNNQFLWLTFLKHAYILVILLSLLLKGIKVCSSICANDISRIGSQYHRSSLRVISILDSQDDPTVTEIRNLIINVELQIIQYQWEFYEDKH